MHPIRPPSRRKLGWALCYRSGFVLGLLCSGGALGFAWGKLPQAAASENYPSIIDLQKGTECPRPLTRCLICHDTAAGGEETANRPFAVTLREYGLTEGKAGRKLDAALDALPEDVDSDQDGASDQTELAICMNPSGEELSEGPGFGCSVQRGRASRGSDAALSACALGLAVAWLLARAARAR